MKRTWDAEAVNALVNDPTIRPHVGGDPTVALDLSGAVADDQNYFLLGPHGGFAFVWTSPHTYEVHTFVLPSGRGRWAFQAARMVLEYMREIGARRVWTRVHPDASNVRTFTLRSGFKSVGQHRSDLGTGPVTFDLFEWTPPCPLPQS